MDKKSYILARTYTDETAAQFGGLKGASCQIKSIVHENGQNIVTFLWVNDSGETRESQMAVEDGTPVYIYAPGTLYHYNDLVIYANMWYRCVVEHVAGATLDPTKFAEIGQADSQFDIVESAADLPPRFTPADRRLYYSIADQEFWLWDGYQWTLQATPLSDAQVNNLISLL